MYSPAITVVPCIFTGTHVPGYTRPQHHSSPLWCPTCAIISTQGASSLMALTSPNCRCTPCAHASPSSCRTQCSSAAPSGQPHHPAGRPGPRASSASEYKEEGGGQGPEHSGTHPRYPPPWPSSPAQAWALGAGGSSSEEFYPHALVFPIRLRQVRVEVPQPSGLGCHHLGALQVNQFSLTAPFTSFTL